MVGVVKEQSVVVVLGPVPPDARHQVGLVPFVDEHKIGVLQDRVQIDGVVIASALQTRIAAVKLDDGPLPVVGLQVAAAPTLHRLVDAYVMAAPHELRGNAAEEVGIAVVPVGYK